MQWSSAAAHRRTRHSCCFPVPLPHQSAAWESALTLSCPAPTSPPPMVVLEVSYSLPDKSSNRDTDAAAAVAAGDLSKCRPHATDAVNAVRVVRAVVLRRNCGARSRQLRCCRQLQVADGRARGAKPRATATNQIATTGCRCMDDRVFAPGVADTRWVARTDETCGKPYNVNIIQFLPRHATVALRHENNDDTTTRNTQIMQCPRGNCRARCSRSQQPCALTCAAD